MSLSINSEYKDWLRELKANIKRTQIKASLAVNSELIQLYWDLGKQIVEKQENTKWGSGFIDQLSKDLKEEFPNMGGLARSNLFSIRNFYLFYREAIVQQLVGQLENTDNQNITKSQQVVGQLQNQLFMIPWGHHILIIQKIKNVPEAIFYEIGRAHV